MKRTTPTSRASTRRAPGRPRKPTMEPGERGYDQDVDPDEQILRTLVAQRLKLRRLWYIAKDALKRKVHVAEATAVIQRVASSREMPAKIRDAALRLLARHAQKGTHTSSSGGVMQLPESWRELIGSASGEPRFIADAQWSRLKGGSKLTKKRWLPRGYQAPSGNGNGKDVVEEGDDDE